MTLCVDIAGLVFSRPATETAPAYRLQIDRLAIPSGARVGLCGESGSGKSTLLDLMALIRRPSALQHFRLGPTDVTADLLRARERPLTRKRRDHISYILQDGGLLPWLSVLANVRLAQYLSRRKGGDITALARHLDIAPVLGKYPASLSGGQRQRAAVLRGLACGAELILADEPTAALDALNAERTMQLLHALPPDRSVIVASHDEALLRRSGFHILRVIMHTTALPDGSPCQIATLVEDPA